MANACKSTGCKAEVPAELAEKSLCAFHFTQRIDQNCTDIRHETVVTPPSHERRQEILDYLRATGELLARMATTAPRLPDEMKARILSTFLTLMNLRENLDRSAARGVVTPPPARTASR